MKKINIKYIKYIFLIFLFTTLQVFFSTQIPKYTAKNIDIGIMSNGIEYAIFDKFDEEISKKFDNNILRNYNKNNEIYTLKENVNKKELEKLTLNKLNYNRAEIIEEISKQNKKFGINNSSKFIIKNSYYMIAFAILSAFFVFLSNLTISYTVSILARDLRKKIFNHIERFTDYNISKFGVSSLITRTTNDISNIQDSLNMILKMSLLAPMMLFFASYQAYMLSPSLMNVLYIFGFLVIILIAIGLYLILPKIKIMQKITDNINNIVKEILTGKRVIRSFKKEKIENEKFLRINTDYKKVHKFLSITQSIINPLFELILNLSAVAVIYYASIKIWDNNIPIGNILAFIQYTGNIVISFMIFAQIFFSIPTAMISYNRIKEVLDEKINICSNEKSENISIIEKLTFENVSFKYDGSESYILENICFSIENNETLGIIGSTGSGKSSIAKLILRFIDHSSGNIFINNKDIRQINIDSLRDNISYTPQEAKILSGTVLENVAFNDKNTDIKRVKKALDMSIASEFAPLEKQITQKATNLSGGQKQRIQIARSLYKNVNLHIFDDSFSALDNITDRKIRENIKEIKSMKIIVSQKISTILSSDKILVLNDGKQVGLGSHEELLKSCEIYKQIYETQTGGSL